MNRFLLFFLILVASYGYSQNDILDQRVSININNQSIEKVLREIEFQSGVSFSYNSDYFPVDSVISINSNTSLRTTIESILGDKIEIKSIGSNIILRNPHVKKDTKSSKKQKYDVKGVIFDSYTGNKLSEVTIYQVDGLRSALSKKDGSYAIKVSSTNRFVELSFSRKNYYDTIIMVTPSEVKNIKIELTPNNIKPISPRKVQDITAPKKRTVDSSAFVKIFVPEKQKRLIDNIPFLGEPQPVQISFLPNMGTNLDMNAAMENKASINIIAGYSRAINGVEFGGFLNIVREDVTGGQFAGFGNLVGGDVDGIQAAGFFNNTKGKVEGFQAAGFINTTLDTVVGVQAAGFINTTNTLVNGAQFAGFGNYLNGNGLNTIQSAGFFNYTKGKIEGFQAAGYFNYATDSITGGQISGFLNKTKKSCYGLQLSGFANIAKDFTGAQISGFFNKAKNVKGLQLGIVNIADSLQGVGIGIFNYVKHGYHPIEVFYSDYGSASLRLKTGTRAFYNIFEAGIGTSSVNDFWHYGYGIGHSFLLKNEKAYADLDITATNFNGPTGYDEYFNLLTKISVEFSYKIIGPVYLFVAPSINSFGYHQNLDVPFNYTLNPIDRSTIDEVRIETWIGYQFGLRI